MSTSRPQSIAASRSASLHHLGDSHPSDADHILLCCFGVELAGARHYRRLHRALRRAGYTGCLARHLIRASPLLARDADQLYRLRQHDE
jgi:hypothetical protein